MRFLGKLPTDVLAIGVLFGFALAMVGLAVNNAVVSIGGCGIHGLCHGMLYARADRKNRS